MFRTKLEQILKETEEIYRFYQNASLNEIKQREIVFKVPKGHPRGEQIQSYSLVQRPIDSLFEETSEGILVLADKAVASLGFVQKQISNYNHFVFDSVESELKTIDYMRRIVKNIKNKNVNQIIGMGGGMLCNISSYTAEQLQSDLTLVPTTVLSMVDSSGGKVRLNAASEEGNLKHFYKSFYEPNKMILDQRFLDSVPENQVRIGMSEVIKHAIFQSEGLYNFLVENYQHIINKEKDYLLKTVVWAADLKGICLNVDIEEQEYGSKNILRAGHEISDRIEERSGLTIPHGLAVSVGIMEELEMKGKEDNYQKAERIFKLYELPTRREELKK
jgi:3-dehydroquinate synthetase